MADVEVLVSRVGTVGHSTADLIRPVPNNLHRETKYKCF